MTEHSSQLLRLLDQRGYIHQMTDAEGLDYFEVPITFTEIGDE